MPSPEDQDPNIQAFLAEATAKELSPLQKAFMPFLRWAGFALIAFFAVTVVAWFIHLPHVPDTKASVEEMSHYHEEIAEANGMVKDFLESVVRFLMPFVTLFLGIVVGRKIKNEE